MSEISHEADAADGKAHILQQGRTYHVIQDGECLEGFDSAADAADYVESIAEALRQDAVNFSALAKAVACGRYDRVEWEGSYLQLAVEVEDRA